MRACKVCFLIAPRELQYYRADAIATTHTVLCCERKQWGTNFVFNHFPLQACLVAQYW